MDKIEQANFEDERVEENFAEFNLDLKLLPPMEEKNEKNL